MAAQGWPPARQRRGAGRDRSQQQLRREGPCFRQPFRFGCGLREQTVGLHRTDQVGRQQIQLMGEMPEFFLCAQMRQGIADQRLKS
jgi:hypothetical protein